MTIDKQMKDAIQFFEDNDLRANDVIKTGKKRGLRDAQIRAGMVRVHARIMDGEKIKPMRLAWRAWEEAKDIQADEFIAMESDKRTLRAKVDSLTKQKNLAIAIGGIGWITAFIFITQYFWGVLWQGR